MYNEIFLSLLWQLFLIPNRINNIRLEAFTATELDKIFSGNRGMIVPLMMEAEMVSETLGFYPQLTRLVAREDFI
jgi:hypothetical protein